MHPLPRILRSLALALAGLGLSHAAPIAVSSYTYDANPPGPYFNLDAEHTRLKDGVIPTSTNFIDALNDGKHVGFGGATPNPRITFDLGARYDLATIALSFWNDSVNYQGLRDDLGDRLWISVSTDNITYSTEVVYRPFTGTLGQEVTSSMTVTGMTGRYARLRIENPVGYLTDPNPMSGDTRNFMLSEVALTGTLAPLPSHTLTYTAGSNGSITGDSPQTVVDGSAGTEVTAVADSGCHFVKWSDDVMTASRTDTNVTADIDVTASFAVNASHTLTYTAGPNGSITGDSPQTVAYGADGAQVTAVADSGYLFVNWSDSSTANPRTDLAVTADIAVTANFAVDIPANELIYSDTLLGSGSALHGTTVDSSATHAGGTAGATWTAADSYNETAPGTIGTSTTTQGAYLPFTPQAGHVYTLTATLEYLGGGGSDWAALGFQTQADLTNSQFHGAAGSAYAWVLVRKAGGGQPQFFGGADTGNGGGFATDSESGLQTVTITLDTTGASWTSHATINGLDSATVTYGANPTDIAYVGFGGVGTTSNTTHFSLSATGGSTHTLTYSAGANGSITGTTPQTVADGTDGSAVTAVADSGYHFVNWSDGVLTASRTDLAVTTDITVTANFNSNTHTLTYSAGANGSISGTTPQTVADGTDGAQVTAVADSGYLFVNWSDSSTANPRTDLAVTADIAVTANFAVDIPANELIYSDTLLGSGSALHGTTVDSSATHAGGTAGATWIAADSYNETATGTIGTSTNTQGAYLPFTPQAGHVYTLTATLEYLGAGSTNWAALGFRTTADVIHTQFHDAASAYAWALLRKADGGQPQFFRGEGTDSGGGFATDSQSGLQTVTITLDTTGANWTTSATIGGYTSSTYIYSSNPTDIAYVGFGGVGTTSNTTHFSLSATGGTSSPYDTWGNGTFAHSFTDKDPGHDPDGDGLTNLQEFAFGLDPTTGASVNPVTPLVGTQFTYTRYATSGLDYTVEYSTDLAVWDTAATTDDGGSTPDANGVQTVTVTVTNAPVDGKLFVRVHAQ